MNSQTFIVSGRQPQQGQKVDIASGFGLPAYNEIQVTYPSGTQEVYSFKQAGQAVGTIIVNYTDSTKNSISSVLKS